MKLSAKNKLALVVVGAVALVVAGIGTAGIKDTKHNLGSTSSYNKTDATAEICVFCHTPHGADTAAAVPLWNKTLPASSGFTTYDSLGTSSLDGGVVAVGSVSIACLSCHDGSQAMDVMINTPGSGTTGPGSLGGTYSTGPNVDGTTFKMLDPNGDGFPMLGKDLTNDHPVGIQYAGGGIDGSTTGKLDFSANKPGDGDFRAPVGKNINGVPVFWVPVVKDTAVSAGSESAQATFTDAYGNTRGYVAASGALRADGVLDATVRYKTDMQLYTRLIADGGNAKGAAATDVSPFVECASCHDPHTTNPTFLRVENNGSAVCLACHVK